jgi:hypothetical protein
MASVRELALGLFGPRLPLGLPDLDVGRRLQQRLDLPFATASLGFFFSSRWGRSRLAI